MLQLYFKRQSIYQPLNLFKNKQTAIATSALCNHIEMLFFLLFFFEINLFKILFLEHNNQSAKLLDPYQLGPNCLQRLSAEDKSCH